MNKLRTMRELVAERIAARNQLLLTDPQVAFQGIMRDLEGVQKRLVDDPTLATFTAYWTGVVSRFGDFDSRKQAIALMLTEWDLIQAEYDNQFQTQPAGSSGINQ